jgi:hypothetical protein
MHYLGKLGLGRSTAGGIPEPVQLADGRTAVLDRSRLPELAQCLPRLHDAHSARFLHRFERSGKIAEGLREALVGRPGICRRLESPERLLTVTES